jgi:lipid-binding SYLF domain-containing protein
MKRLFRAALWAALPLLAAIPAARAQTTQQEIVDRATLTLQDLYSKLQPKDPLWVIRHARGVIICPEVFRASFLFGGSGGACVMAARDAAGNWSYPAFYGMLSGSVGFQIGLQDVELLMLVMTEHGLNAVMDSQFKLGADASATIATLGTGIEGATSADLSADILVVGKSRGLFAGVSLQGSVLTSRTPWNLAYYGQPYAARQITLQGQARNQGAEPLREMLLHYSGRGDAGYSAQAATPGYAPAYPPGYGQGGATGGAPVQLAPASPRGVQQQSLPPPR